MGGFLRRREFTPTGFFLGLDNGDPSQDEPLEAPILVETTPKRQGIACQLREAFLMRLALRGRTQEVHATGLIDHEQVFDRVAFPEFEDQRHTWARGMRNIKGFRSLTLDRHRYTTT